MGVWFSEQGVGVAALGPNGGLATAEFRPADDEEGTIEALRGAVHDHGLRRRPTVCVLPRGRYEIQQLQAPAVPDEELAAAVRWRLKDLISVSLEDAVIDTIAVPQGPSRRESMVYGVAARRQEVERLNAMVAEAGLRVAAVDIPEMALRNLAARIPEQGGGVAVLGVDEDDGLLTITRHDTLYLARGLEMGAVHLRADSHQVGERLALELQRSLDYYDSQLYGAPPGVIGVLPLAEFESGLLVDQLNAELGVPVRLLDVADLLGDEEPLAPARQRRVALAVGAALRRGQGGTE